MNSEHRESSIEQLLAACEEIAKLHDDGHMTIYRFTTGWKVTLGTPRMELEEQVVLSKDIEGGMTLREALKAFLREPVDLDDKDRQERAMVKFDAERNETYYQEMLKEGLVPGQE